MIRQQAFTGSEKLLKGNLHCHTTRSDGKASPGELLRIYAENGYDFTAVTDHMVYNYKNFAPDTGILVIPGMEADRNLANENGRCFHTVFIGPEEDSNGFWQDERFSTGFVKDQTEYSEKILRDAYAKNNMVIYCHPEWSCTPYTSFHKMEGIFAMEIWNSVCAMEWGCDKNAYGWDDILRTGRRIWGVASDDAHDPKHMAHGWVRVNAEKNVDSVLTALREGAFYASTGPEIYDFYVDGNTATVKCSPASRIRFIGDIMPARMKEGENLTELTVRHSDLDWLTEHYLRVEVTDAEGHMAWTNPIFLK